MILPTWATAGVRIGLIVAARLRKLTRCVSTNIELVNGASTDPELSRFLRSIESGV